MKKTRKKILIMAALTLILMLIMPGSTFAAGEGTRVIDEANLLSDSEKSSLSSRLDSISSKYGVDVVVYTDTSLYDMTPEALADYMCEQYSDDCIVFMVNMEAHDWWISTRGFAITAFTDAGRKYITDDITPYLTDKEYAKCFDEFANYADDYLDKAKQGKPYDSGNLPKKPFKAVQDGIIAVLAGLGAGGIRAGSLKAETKTVRKATKASTYLTGNLMIQGNNEVFTGSRMVPRTQSSSGGGGSSTHVSSSGVTHGGSGGKF